MADFPMCRLTRCLFKENCLRHWASGTKEEVFGQSTISHHPNHFGHTPDRECLGYEPKEHDYTPKKRKKQEKGKA